MHRLLVLLSSLWLTATVSAQEQTIDISGNNTSSDYISYSTAISLPAGKTVNVKMARYCAFSSTITGKGTLNLYGGGERCYLGTKGGGSWPNWTNYTGDIHIYPFPENSSSAGFYGVVLSHGGKSFSPENVEEDVRSGKVNKSMENNKVTLHNGATMSAEANTAGAGFRIGELQAEVGSTLQGYIKNQRAAYYLLGCMNTDATLAGTIRPTDYRDDTPLGILKEGTGTLNITGNNNYLSGSLRVLSGRVLVNNNRAEAESKKLRGGLGAKSNANEAIAYVFEDGLLGGTGSIGGTVDNYGTIEPGNDGIGLLTIKNYQTPSKNANLFVRPASVLRFKITSMENHDQLAVSGMVKYFNMTQDFSTSDKKPLIQIVLDEETDLKPGSEFCLLTAKSKATAAGDWHFELKQPTRYTWELIEQEADGAYTLTLRLVSFDDPDNPENPDDPDHPDNTDHMGAFYDDGISDSSDSHTLRYYAEKSGKRIGVALATYKGYQSDRDEGGKQFNLMVAENEMKMDALQPSQGQFSWGSADQLVSFAQKNNMAVRGHCLVWHTQQPTWVSSDGGKKNDKGWTRQQALDIMKNHITNVMKHFKGKVVEWDVVNECLDDDQTVLRSNPDGYKLRSTVWQLAIGDDYIDSAFVFAHRADPTARLFLNDYDVEFQGKAKSVAFQNLVKHLQQRNIPIDGVGLQCHFSVGDVDSVKLEGTIRRFADLNLLCNITELDIGVPSTTNEYLEEQARLYRVITDIVLNNDNCPYMLIWGLKDNDSWRSASNPLLYTSGMAKKPAWYAVRSALRHRNLVTGVEQVVTPAVNKATVYDLSGRKMKVNSLLPGIYITEGKKLIKK